MVVVVVVFLFNNIKPSVLSLPSLLFLGEFLPVVHDILACYALTCSAYGLTQKCSIQYNKGAFTRHSFWALHF